jgi:hypothetical protein
MPLENIFIFLQFVEDLTKNKYTTILETGFPSFNVKQSFKKQFQRKN